MRHPKSGWIMLSQVSQNSIPIYPMLGRGAPGPKFWPGPGTSRDQPGPGQGPGPGTGTALF